MLIISYYSTAKILSSKPIWIRKFLDLTKLEQALKLLHFKLFTQTTTSGISFELMKVKATARQLNSIQKKINSTFTHVFKYVELKHTRTAKLSLFHKQFNPSEINILGTSAI